MSSKRADAAGGDQRNLLLDAGRLEELARLRDDVLEVEARVVQVGDLRGTQVAAGQARVLDDDGVGQALLALPLLHDQLHAARVGQDGDKGGLRVVLRQVGQVQRQAGAHHHGVDAGFQRGGDRVRVFAHRAHDVDGQQAHALGEFACGADLAPQRFQVGGIDGHLGRIAGLQVAGLLPSGRGGAGAGPRRTWCRRRRARPRCRPGGAPRRRCPCRPARRAAAYGRPGSAAAGRCAPARRRCRRGCRGRGTQHS